MRFIAFATTVAALALSGAAHAQNLFVNGDFSAGNTGFTTDYLNFTTPDLPEGYLGVGTNPTAFHSAFTTFGDHTSGAGNMAVYNGAPIPGQVVWSQTVNGLTAGTDYYFSSWLSTVYPDNPANLQFLVNGQAIGSVFNAPASVGTWSNFYAGWNAVGTSATFTIVNQNTIGTGNDFAIDDLALSTSAPGGNNVTAPEPGTLALLALPMLGVFARRRF